MGNRIGGESVIFNDIFSIFNAPFDADIIITVQVDDDLKDDDIREAFKIFDNVSNHFLSLISGVNSF